MTPPLQTGRCNAELPQAQICHNMPAETLWNSL